MMKKKWKFIMILFFLIVVFTNPTTQDYRQFSILKFGEPIPKEVNIERINFFLFSMYTPVIFNEYGITHLGIFGHFFKISDGQFDYPDWLELFH